MLAGCALIAFGPALALFWIFLAQSAQLVVLMVGRFDPKIIYLFNINPTKIEKYSYQFLYDLASKRLFSAF
jgi:hypothetical protein